MPRQRRIQTEKTPLARYLSQIMAQHRLTIREAAKLAGCAPSVFGAWLQGAFPGAETIPCLKRFCSLHGSTLDYALTGDDSAPESKAPPVLQIATNHPQLTQHDYFEGLAHVRIVRLPPGDKKETD